MTVKYLVHPVTSAIVAKMISDKEIEIYDPEIKVEMEGWGISVDKVFKEKYKTPSCRIRPKDVAKDVFAKAFEQFYFPRNLRNGQYKWYGSEIFDDPAEIARKVIEIHRRLAAEKASQSGEKQDLKRPREEEKKNTDSDSPEELPPKKAKKE